MRGYDVGPILREMRLRRNLSLAELGRQAGVSKSAIVRIERGDRNPGLVTLTGLAQALRIKFVIEGAGLFIEDAPDPDRPE